MQLNNQSEKSSPSIFLDDILTRAPYITDLSGFLKEGDWIRALKYWLSEHDFSVKPRTTQDIRLTIERSIAEIDHIINDQLNEIIHNPFFQKIESSWRGLWYLVVQAEGSKNTKIKFLDISWAEITRDINRALEFDQSQLFIKIYSDEFGMPGGEPYGVLIGDYELTHKPTKSHPYNDVDTLKGLAEIAAASFAPFIAAASPEIFGLDNFSALGSPLNLKSFFQQTEYVRWQHLRDMPDTRFVGLTLPRMLMRKPYRSTPGSYKGLFFYEKQDTKWQDTHLWGNAAYGFGAVLIREFASVGWFGHIRGVPRDHIGGGLLTNLPVDHFLTDGHEISRKPSTDVVITDKTEKELSNLGFIPLCQCFDVPYCAFYNNQSLQRSKSETSSNLTTAVNSKIASMLQYVLCGSRIAHYIKVMIRDKIGSFTSAEMCEDMLRAWLIKYSSGRGDLSWELQARYPISKSEVVVKEHPAKPGQYVATIRIAPQYQVDQMVSELELITELIQSK